MELNTNKSSIVSLNLKKGMSLDLKKYDDTLKQLGVGFGWQTKYDLDAIVFLVNENGKIEETVCYQHLNGYGVYLGDNIEGEKDVDCENIIIDFSKMKKNIKKIMLLANIFCAKDTFSNIKDSYIRLYNKENNIELCKYYLEEDDSNYNAFHFANLIKNENEEWSFVTIGVGMNGSISELRKQLDK